MPAGDCAYPAIAVGCWRATRGAWTRTSRRSARARRVSAVSGKRDGWRWDARRGNGRARSCGF